MNAFFIMDYYHLHEVFQSAAYFKNDTLVVDYHD